MLPVILPRSEHNVSRRDIDPEALKVLYRLHRAGHVAYLVGGGVRDLLLSRQPKDFDVGTSAHPGEVRKLFRNCRLIGRRFRLAHVIFGPDKIVEVSTFRQKADEPADGDELIVRDDNTFGTPEEDAERRDITINGLFYDIATFSVIDFVGGLADLAERTIRTIGNPNIRLREDPVRMLRVVKFASRLRFRIAEDDLAAINRHRTDILLSSPERLRLELGRLLGGGSAEEAFRLLDSTGLLDVLAPELAAVLAKQRHGNTNDETGHSLWRMLRGLDALSAPLGRGQSLPQPVMLAILLAPLMLKVRGSKQAIDERRGLGFVTRPVGRAAGRVAGAEVAATLDDTPQDPDEVDRLIASFVGRFCVPRREAEQVVRLLCLQPRLYGNMDRPSTLRAMLRRPELSESLLVLEAAVLGGLGDPTRLRWWRSQAAKHPELINVSSASSRKRPSRKRRSTVAPSSSSRSRRVPGSTDALATDGEEESESSTDTGEQQVAIPWPPDVRRKRRRKRSGRRVES